MVNQNIPRGHHYVWQFYLKKWQNDKKIWWNRIGNIQRTSTNKILKEKDMYKIHKLNELEKAILKLFFFDDNRKGLKETLQQNFKSLNSFDMFEEESPDRIIELLVKEHGMEIIKDDEKLIIKSL